MSQGYDGERDYEVPKVEISEDVQSVTVEDGGWVWLQIMDTRQAHAWIRAPQQVAIPRDEWE